MTGSSLAIDISKVSGASRRDAADTVAVEEPLEIQLSSRTATASAARSVSITMRTPGDDTELALGFLFTEGIIDSHTQVAAVREVGEPDPASGRRNSIRIELMPDVMIDLGRLERHFYTTSSCGVCGKASLDALRIAGRQSLNRVTTHFRRDVIVAMPDKLRERQRLFTETGGLHAAAVFDPGGEIIVLREDVGRHNAVDKVVGWLLMHDRLPAHEYGLLVSGRASFELIQKALAAGMPLLAAVGAPSSLAVQTAREFSMTLIGFLRDNRFNIYADAGRID